MVTAADGMHPTGMHSCFTGVCDSVHRGACVVARRGMHGCRGCVVAWGVCVVVGVCVVAGGMHGYRGCMVAGGMCMVVGGCGCWGVCVVARGHAWLQGEGHAWLPGGVRGCRGAYVGYDKIWSMSGRYASYWNAFLFNIIK